MEINTLQTTSVKTAVEIGWLSGQLTPKNKSYVLNTINALLFSQETDDKPKK